jgi:uncharacterized iron-regulated membrane protein
MLALNPVYERVTGALFDYERQDSFMAYMLPQPIENPKLSWREAQEAGQRYTAELAAKHRFNITRPMGMAYIAEFGVYTYDVHTTADIRGHGWDTGVWVDGKTGALSKTFLPHGQRAGNTVSTVLWGLHYGDIRDNLAYRTFVCSFGLAIAMLSVTGVYIWWKKRKGRLLAASRRLG